MSVRVRGQHCRRGQNSPDEKAAADGIFYALRVLGVLQSVCRICFICCTPATVKQMQTVSADGVLFTCLLVYLPHGGKQVSGICSAMFGHVRAFPAPNRPNKPNTRTGREQGATISKGGCANLWCSPLSLARVGKPGVCNRPHAASACLSYPVIILPLLCSSSCLRSPGKRRL